MKKLSIPSYLEEKIYDTKFYEKNVEITTYFPLPQNESQLILDELKELQVNFKSIFSDTISESEWQQTKVQIKKKFQDELFGIDSIL